MFPKNKEIFRGTKTLWLAPHQQRAADLQPDTRSNQVRTSKHHGTKTLQRAFWTSLMALLLISTLVLSPASALPETDCSDIEDMNNRAAQHFLANELDAAEDLYGMSAACAPNAETYWRLAMVHGRAGDVQESVLLYQKTLELEPHVNIKVNALSGLAGAHLQLEEYEATIAYATEAIESMETEIGRKTVWSVWATRSEAYTMLGDLEQALSDRTQALEFRPNAPHQYNARGLIHSDLGDYQAAIADFETAIALGGAGPEVQENLTVAKQAQRSTTQEATGPTVSYAKSKGAKGKVGAAAEAGWAIGKWLDSKLDLSDTAADYWADKYPAPGWLQDLF